MAVQTSFWQRMGKMLRNENGAEARPNGNGKPTAAAPPAVSGIVEPTRSQRGEPGRLRDLFSPRAWWQRRESRRAALRARSERVADAVLALQQHFARSEERAAHLTRCVERVAATLEQLGEAQRTQTEQLRGLSRSAESTERAALGLADSVGRLPAALQSQSEVMRDVARNLELSRETDGQLAQTMQRVHQAVDAAGANASAQVQAVDRLRGDSARQHEAVAGLLLRQSRLVVVFGGLFVALLAVATVALLWLLVGNEVR